MDGKALHTITNAFLSTPSARRATRTGQEGRRSHDISIHALREEGDLCGICGNTDPAISIHALREEGDIGFSEFLAVSINFYPRPPRGGRQY